MSLVNNSQADSRKARAINITGLPAYSDSAGTLRKFHCKQSSPFCVTVTGVTVSGGGAVIEFLGMMLQAKSLKSLECNSYEYGSSG